MENLRKIEHVVVLMFENRSFDNVFGWLYDPANPSPFNREPPANFEGLYGKQLSNPGPKGNVPAGKGNEPPRAHDRDDESAKRARPEGDGNAFPHRRTFPARLALLRRGRARTHWH